MENSLFSVLQKMLPMASLPTMYCGWWWSFDLNRSPGHKITVMTMSEFIWEQFGMTCHCFYNWPPHFDRHVFPFFFCLFVCFVCLFVFFTLFCFSVKIISEKKRKKTTSDHIKCDQKLYFCTVMFMFLTSKSFLMFWRNKEIKELAAVFDNKIFNCHVIWCCVL